MRLVALLPWFDESSTWLAHGVASLSKLGVDHLVAIDGCYELFPRSRERASSSVLQASTVMSACDGLGIGCTIVRPRDAWVGNEVAKRNALFDYGRLACDVGDWFYCFDSDESVMDAPANVRVRLEETVANVAEVHTLTLVDPCGTEGEAAAAPVIGLPHTRMSGYRCFFRNLPGLSVELAHYIVGYDRCDGERGYLRGRFDMHDVEPALELTGLMVEHRTNMRERSRREAAAEYYRLRDACGAERISSVQVETPHGELARIA